MTRRPPRAAEYLTDKKPEQHSLFHIPAPWEEHWQGMPEFVQEKQREYAKIIVRFRSAEDLAAFAELIGQRLNRNSQCTWFPELVVDRSTKKRYVDEP